MIRTLSLLLFVIFCKISAAQECGGYMLLRKNTTVTYAITGPAPGPVTYRTSAVISDSGKCSSTVTYQVPFGKKRTVETTWQVLYENNVLKIPLSSLLPIGVIDFERKKKKDSKPEEELYLEYPTNIQADQQFENISMAKSGGSAQGDVTVRISIINREVIGQEKLTTSSGSWECFKIKAEYKVKTSYDKIDWKTSDTDLKYTLIEWFAPGVGVIKAETSVMGQTLTAVLSNVLSN